MAYSQSMLNDVILVVIPQLAGTDQKSYRSLITRLDGFERAKNISRYCPFNRGQQGNRIMKLGGGVIW